MLEPRYTVSVALTGTGGSIEPILSSTDGAAVALAPFFVGPQGPIGSADGAFMVINRLSEIAGDPDAQVQARQNLGVHYVDGGTFN